MPCRSVGKLALFFHPNRRRARYQHERGGFARPGLCAGRDVNFSASTHIPCGFAGICLGKAHGLCALGLLAFIFFWAGALVSCCLALEQIKKGCIAAALFICLLLLLILPLLLQLHAQRAQQFVGVAVVVGGCWCRAGCCCIALIGLLHVHKGIGIDDFAGIKIMQFDEFGAVYG